MLVAEGFHQKISKSYIYTMIAFSLLVELLNMRLRKKHESIKLKQGGKNDDRDIGKQPSRGRPGINFYIYQWNFLLTSDRS